jgi:ribonuclease P protein component
MLPKALRITAKEWKGIKARPSYRGAFFDVSVTPAPTTKFACVISKKRIGKAVDRNRAKRKVYALLPGVKTSSPSLVFIYPTKHILTAHPDSLKEEIQKAFATL